MYCAIETSFDETGIAIADSAGLITASLLSSQVELHEPYGGCVPELAARTHLFDLPQLWRRLSDEQRASVRYLGVTAGPGLPGCLLSGISFARGLAEGLCLQLYGLNHLSGHIFSPFMPLPDRTEPALRFPQLALLVSGGHTELFLVRALDDIELLGQTQDDAVGELLDKVSKMLGHGYPGGAKLEKLARLYPGMSAEADYDGPFNLPVPMRGHSSLDFSYSGLKTAVVRYVQGHSLIAGRRLSEDEHPALLAALFSVICESLWIKVEHALDIYDIDLLTVSGGVAINGFLRANFARRAKARGIELAFPQPRWCLDNADMLAWLLKLTVESGLPALTFDARSNWTPGEAA